MRDEHDDRLYQDFRPELNEGIARLFASVANVFVHLVARLYGAPWSSPTGAAPETCKDGLPTP